MTKRGPTAVEWLCDQDVRAKLGVKSTVTLWRWVRKGTFPKPVYFGAQKRWSVAAVDAWIAARITESSSASP